jgi:hypothetical protein
MISIHSKVFENLYNFFFFRIEKKCYLNIFLEKEKRIFINLPRLNLSFYID